MRSMILATTALTRESGAPRRGSRRGPTWRTRTGFGKICGTGYRAERRSL